ncbi:MAG: DUF6726 family protein [Campylobacterota bacterium]|nr:DUF6726 family protein [Campylobacterota bacterium]
MKKLTLYLSILLIVLLSGCTQVVTAPIYVAGAAVSTSIAVTGSAVGTVVGSDEEEEEE